MRRLAFALLVMSASAPAAFAHTVPARRAVVVQADAGGLAVLVTWTSARGPQGSQMLARAAWGRSARALPALRALAGAEALRGLEVTADGKPLQPASISVKVRVETQTPARIVAVVLVTYAPVVGRTARVRALTGAETQLSWRDRTAGRVSSPQPEREWQSGRRSLRLAWRAED